MKLTLVFFLLLSLGVSAQAATTADFPTVVNYDFLNNGTVTVPGRLFQPSQATANPTQEFPLVIFLHGDWEAGTNNTSQINQNVDNLLAGCKANGIYLYAPQSTVTTSPVWTNLSRLNEVMLMAGQLARDYNIDPNMITITGLSDGGAGSWLSVSNFTNILAAAVPICGNANVKGPAAVNKPIWAFHARNDAAVNVATTRNNINAIRTADPTVGTFLYFPLTDPSYYTFYSSYTGSGLPEDGASFYSLRNLNYSEYTSGGHFIWTNAYGESALYSWILGQTQANQATPITQPVAGEKILFDFGPTITGYDGAGQFWNSPGGTNGTALPEPGTAAGTGTEMTLAPAVVFAYTNTGHRTPVTLSVTRPFNGISTSGTTSSAIYQTSITREGWEQGNTISNANSIANPAELQLTGLVPLLPYKLKIYGSDNNANNNSPSRYTINNSATTYADLATRGNVNNFVTFSSVAADVNGHIAIEIAPAPFSNPNAFYANISAMEVSPIITLPYSAWESNYFGADTVDGASTASPYNDGVSNLLKYFCDINPTHSITAADRAYLPSASTINYGNVPYLALTYRQSLTLTGVTAQMQTSTNLQNWQNVTPTVLSTTTDPVTRDPIIEVGVPTNGAPRLFIRLTFTGP